MGSRSRLGPVAAAAVYVGTRWLGVAVAGVFAWGVITGFFRPPMQTLLQRATPPETHGRVMAVAGTLDGIGGLVSVPLTGLVVGALGVSGTGLAVVAILVVAGLAGLARAGAVPPARQRREAEVAPLDPARQIVAVSGGVTLRGADARSPG